MWTEWTEVLVWEDAEYRMHVMRGDERAGERGANDGGSGGFSGSVDALPANVIDNLRWLVPLALDRDVAMPIEVRSAAAEGSGLTERDRGGMRKNFTRGTRAKRIEPCLSYPTSRCISSSSSGALWGRPLEKLVIAKPFVLRTFDPPVSEVVGRTVRGVRRMGKRIVLEMDDERFIVIHLMIAGRLKWREVGGKLPPKGSILATFHFPTGVLVLTEAGTARRASMHLVRGEEGLREFDRGGLEVLDATLAEFSARLRSENHTLKRALADPRLFSGIGNAYSDEILHRARLSPVKLTRRIRDEEVERLFEATKATLDGVDRRGCAAKRGREISGEGDGVPRRDGGARAIRGAVPRVRGAGAADSVCVERDELLCAMSDWGEAVSGSGAVAAVGEGLAEVDRRHRVKGWQ